MFTLEIYSALKSGENTATLSTTLNSTKVKNIASPIIPSNSQTPKPDLPHKTANVSCDKTEEQKLLDGLTFVHPTESLVDPDCFEYLIQFSLGFTMVVYEKIYLEALINTFVSKI